MNEMNRFIFILSLSRSALRAAESNRIGTTRPTRAFLDQRGLDRDFQKVSVPEGVVSASWDHPHRVGGSEECTDQALQANRHTSKCRSHPIGALVEESNGVDPRRMESVRLSLPLPTPLLLCTLQARTTGRI